MSTEVINPQINFFPTIQPDVVGAGVICSTKIASSINGKTYAWDGARFIPTDRLMRAETGLKYTGK
jgi:hypothetical protein